MRRKHRIQKVWGVHILSRKRKPRRTKELSCYFVRLVSLLLQTSWYWILLLVFKLELF